MENDLLSVNIIDIPSKEKPLSLPWADDYPLVKDFVAIDFETAKDKNPCQIGMAIVSNGEIVETVNFLIRPVDNVYNPYTIAVHHITPSMTENAMEFPEIWAEIGHYFSDNYIIAHNAPFDKSVLESVLNHYNIPYPAIKGFICTCQLNGGEGLAIACARYGIVLKNHHDGEDDAISCAKLYLAYVNGERPLDDDAIQDVIQREKAEKNYFASLFEGHTSLRGDVLKMNLEGADPANPFYARKVVITGIFSIDREELANRIKKMGADIDQNVGKKLNYLLVGDSPGPSKIAKVNKMIEEELPVMMLFQDDVDAILEGRDYAKYYIDIPILAPKEKRERKHKERKTTWPVLVEKFKRKVNGENVEFRDEEISNEDFRLLEIYYKQQQKVPLTKKTLLESVRILDESQELQYKQQMLACFCEGEHISKADAYQRMQSVFENFGLCYNAKLCALVELGVEFEEYKVKGIHHLLINKIPTINLSNMYQTTLFDDEDFKIENPLKGKRVSFVGKFSNRAALIRKVKEVGADSKSNDTLVKNTDILVVGEDVSENVVNKKVLYEHDGFHPIQISIEELNSILRGNHSGIKIPEKLVKEVRLNMSYYNWVPAATDDDEEDSCAEKKKTRKSSPLVYGEGNPISGLEIYVPEISNIETGILRQIVGNLGGYANAEFYDDTDLVLLGTDTLSKLEQGVRDETIRYIENKYNSSSSTTFNVQFTCESEFITWVEQRVQNCNDEATMRLLDLYYKSHK